VAALFVVSHLPLTGARYRPTSGVIPEHSPVSYNALVAVMNTLLGIVIAAVSVCTFAGVIWLFIWAAKKDGEEDRAIQKRLGIRRRTRLGR